MKQNVGSIDRFIRVKLDAAGFPPAADADKRTLLRRVTFEFAILNRSGDLEDLALDDAALTVRDRGLDVKLKPVLLLVNGIPAPAPLVSGDALSTVKVTFLIPRDAVPMALDIDPPWEGGRGNRASGVRFRFP